MPAAIPYAAVQYDSMGAQSAVFALCVALALQPGTGGLQTREFCLASEEMGYPLVHSEPGLQVPVEDAAHTPVDNLTRIRAILRPAVVDLAHALGVSRQAVYDWQTGKPVSADNAARLADLAKAADVLAAEGVSASAQLIRRPIQSGQTLLDIVRNGGSAETAAGVLARIVRREAQQREKLASRLASRPRQSINAEELGSPVLDEVAEAAL